MSKATPRGFAFNVTRETILSSELLVADSHWTRLKGLLGTKQKDFYRGGQGLWIVPCHGVHTFGMGFAIDVIYLNAENEVVYLVDNVKPWHITPIIAAAETLLELPARTAAQTGTEVGDKIEIQRTPVGDAIHSFVVGQKNPSEVAS